MESLSDNWLQWMEMIWSVLKQMRFALRGFAVETPIWFGFGGFLTCFPIQHAYFLPFQKNTDRICSEELQHEFCLFYLQRL